MDVTSTKMTHVYHGNIRYELGALLGRGGFGICYKAEKLIPNGNKFIRKTVAVKKFSIQKIKETNKKPFLKYELGLHGRMNHCNVVALYDSFTYEESIYFVLEYCAQRSIADMLAKNVNISLQMASHYFKQLLHGISYMHGHQILHRDIKVGNLLITDAEVLKITDFGLAATITRSYLERNYVCGTPNYLSPEVLLRKGHVPASDVWSCGVVLYTMFGATPPFQKPELTEIYQSIVVGSYKFSNQHHTDVNLKNIISSILQLDPDKRPLAIHLLQHPFIQYSNLIEKCKFQSHYCKQDKMDSTLSNKTISLRCLTLPQNNIDCSFKNKPDGKKKRHRFMSFFNQIFQRSDSCVSIINADIPRSLTVRDVSDLKVDYLLECLQQQPVWEKKAVQFHGNWITRWYDKSDVSGFYYILSNGSRGVIYNDNFTCFENKTTGRFYFTNLSSQSRVFDEQDADAVSRFYEPLVNDLKEICHSNKNDSIKKDDWISWLNFDLSNPSSLSYVEAWQSSPLDNDYKYNVFYLSDESVQVDFGNGQFSMRLCGSLCYFYQPTRTGFVVESANLDVWCRQPTNRELVDILCEIYIPDMRV